ncbi:MAG: formimidoylglutamase [Imperialibacter sp.]
MYRSPDRNIWRGRTDKYDGPDGARWHHVIQMLDLSRPIASAPGQRKFALLGFCSDEGVRKNFGRRGASEGPYAIRKMATNLPWHSQPSVSLFDAGDVLCPNGNLETVQKLLGQKVATLLDTGYFPILLGGGHEIAYGHFLGAFAHCPDKKIGIVNLDAHFDLRNDPHAPTSGTPFLQIANFLGQEAKPFDYMCLGIQPSGNTAALYKTAHQKKVKYLEAGTLFQLSTAEIEKVIHKFTKPLDHIYLTICLDVMDGAFAPGVSAPAVMGLAPQQVAELVRITMGTGKVLTCDIAEMNPAFDQDNRTAKLAANLIFRIVNESKIAK